MNTKPEGNNICSICGKKLTLWNTIVVKENKNKVCTKCYYDMLTKKREEKKVTNSKNNNRVKVIFKKIIRCILIFFIIIIVLAVIFGDSDNNNGKNNETNQNNSSPTSEITTIEENKNNESNENQKLVNKINKVALKEFDSFEVSIWDKDSNFGSKGNPPYEIVLNATTTVKNCDVAKRKAYYAIEALYMDKDIRNNISRVLVTFPYYLRVSLGASDGVQMANNDVFSGPTNFWSVMEKTGLGEKETGSLSNRTWGNYLVNCN